ncbi:hypothetical protein ACS0TY_033743 [Phlomoides rotata]
MLEWIRHWFMERFQVNRDRAVHKWKGRLPPKITKILQKHMDRIGDCIPIKANNRHYQIECSDGSQYAVDLLLKSCTCRVWGLSGIPCRHALAAIINGREDPESFVDDCYTLETYRKVRKNRSYAAASMSEVTICTQDKVFFQVNNIGTETIIGGGSKNPRPISTSIRPPTSRSRGLIDEDDEEWEALLSQASSTSLLTGLGMPAVRGQPGPTQWQQLHMSKEHNQVPPSLMTMHSEPVIRAPPTFSRGGLVPQFTTQSQDDRASKRIFY